MECLVGHDDGVVIRSIRKGCIRKRYIAVSNNAVFVMRKMMNAENAKLI